MNKPLIEFIKTHPDAKLPKYAHEHDVGADLYSIETRIIKAVGWPYVLDTGLTLAYCDPDFEIQIRSKSGLAVKGIQVVNSPGTVDPGYRGPIKVILTSHFDMHFHVLAGEKIAQLVVAPRYRADFGFTEEKTETDRGTGGFGSTGV